jgi:hypothetical protein
MSKSNFKKGKRETISCNGKCKKYCFGGTEHKRECKITVRVNN